MSGNKILWNFSYCPDSKSRSLSGNLRRLNGRLAMQGFQAIDGELFILIQGRPIDLKNAPQRDFFVGILTFHSSSLLSLTCLPYQPSFLCFRLPRDPTWQSLPT